MAQRRKRTRARRLTRITTNDRPSAPPIAGWLHVRLQPYFVNTALPRARAHAILNAAFALSFGGQLMVISVLTFLAAVLAGRQGAPNEILSWVLIGGAYVHLMLGVLVLALGLRSTMQQRARVLSANPAPSGANRSKQVRALRQGGLSRALFGSILFTIPGWFLAFAWLTGQTTGTLIAILLALLLGYGLGLFQMRPLARAISELDLPVPEER